MNYEYDPQKQLMQMEWEPQRFPKLTENAPFDILLDSQTKLSNAIQLLETLHVNIQKSIDTFGEYKELIRTFSILLGEVIGESKLWEVLNSNYTVLNVIKNQSLIDAHSNFSFSGSLIVAFNEHMKCVHKHKFKMIGECNECCGQRDVFKRSETHCQLFLELPIEKRCICNTNEPYSICSYCVKYNCISKLEENLSMSIGQKSTCLVECQICRKYVCPFDLLCSDGKRKMSTPENEEEKTTPVSVIETPNVKNRRNYDRSNSEIKKNRGANLRTCSNCGKTGHYAVTCKEPQKEANQKHNSPQFTKEPSPVMFLDPEPFEFSPIYMK